LATTAGLCTRDLARNSDVKPGGLRDQAARSFGSWDLVLPPCRVQECAGRPEPACALPRCVVIKKFGGPAGIRTQNQGIHLSLRFPVGVDYLFTLACSKEQRSGAGRSSLSLRTLGLAPSPQVVSAPSGGVPPAWLRVASACAGRFP